MYVCVRCVVGSCSSSRCVAVWVKLAFIQVKRLSAHSAHPTLASLQL